MRWFILSSASRRRLALTCALGMCASALVGCTTDQVREGFGKLGSKGSESSAPATNVESRPGEGSDGVGMPNPTLPNSSRGSADSSAAGDAPSAPGEAVPASWRDAVAEVEQQFGGQAGIAVALPGSSSTDSAQVVGSLTTGVAWSTSKVPVAIAVARKSGVDSSISSAITASDNAAAEAMWSSLGDPLTAAASTQAVLRDGGDHKTVVQSKRVRPGFTAFGQTQWALTDQATFGSNLQCIDGGSAVAQLMDQIAPDQSYGLGQISGAHFKGGWGPDGQGAYLVRQFGFIPGVEPGTFVGVAIAAKAADGTYESGQQMLNRLAKQMSARPMAGGSC